ncbi:MAG TPA: peptidyl-prolyl cis-trans isomerase [Saprospiraceae bacterium]|nr:peptidyl-prolyl cis-trans isomerase [Saprospiraceae bacterium]
MALIGRIRKNSLLLILLIGGALAAFIIMSMFSGNNGSLLGGDRTTVGNINGQKIDIKTFSSAEKIQQFLYGNSAADAGGSRRNIIWNYFVENALVKETADNLGLTVSKEELLDLEFGPNPSPIIKGRFVNPNTRQFDPSRVAKFKTALDDGTLSKDPNWGPVWAYQEKEIIKDRLQSKITAMVTKAMYTPSWMVEQVHADQNQRVDFEYVKIPFADIDADVELTDADYKSYLANNKAKFRQDEETRKIDYVVFDVKASKKDSADIKDEIVKLLPAFRSTDDDSSFIALHLGFIDKAYFKKSDLNTVMNKDVVDSLFVVPNGTVIGPYIDGGAYRAIKLLDRKVIADSVKSQHILRRANVNDPVGLAQAHKTIDSLMTLINSGAVFDSLAFYHSQDFSNAKKGGDLGYTAINKMVKPYNDVLFFTGKKGGVYKVQSQFGVHLVKINDKKFITNEESVRLAYINKPIIPSEPTQDKIRNKARSFLRANNSLEAVRKAAAQADDIEVQSASGIKRNDYTLGSLGAGTDSRRIIKWAFNAATSVGDVSPEIYAYQELTNYYDNKYVIAGLSKIIPAGMPSVSDIKDEIELQVMNLKKAEKVKSQINSSDLDAIAKQFSSVVDTAKNVVFTSPNVTGLGNEPKVIASAFKLKLNEVSKPIIGNNGVYVVKLVNKVDSSTPINIPQIRQVENMKTQNQMATKWIQAMKKNAKIEDFRSKFY